MTEVSLQYSASTEGFLIVFCSGWLYFDDSLGADSCTTILFLTFSWQKSGVWGQTAHSGHRNEQCRPSSFVGNKQPIIYELALQLYYGTGTRTVSHWSAGTKSPSSGETIWWLRTSSISLLFSLWFGQTVKRGRTTWYSIHTHTHSLKYFPSQPFNISQALYRTQPLIHRGVFISEITIFPLLTLFLYL